MKKYFFVLILLGLLGCGKEGTQKQDADEKKKPPPRPIPTSTPSKKAEEEKKAPKDPQVTLAYTYGDLVLALQEDAKARDFLANGGRVTGTDTRLLKPDARHDRIRTVIRDLYMEDMSLANVLKLRDDLCKANELKPDQVNALTLDEVADAFKKKAE
jgi:hypothetical protein